MTGVKSCVGCTKSLQRNATPYRGTLFCTVSPLYIEAVLRRGTQNSYTQSPYTKLLFIEPWVHKTFLIYRAPNTQNFYIQSPQTKLLYIEPLHKTSPIYRAPTQKLLYIKPWVRKTCTYRAPTQNFYLQSPRYAKLLHVEPHYAKLLYIEE